MDILTSSNKHPDRERSDECTTEVRIKAADTAERVSRLLDRLGKSAKCSSGFRTSGANKASGGATQSAHLTGEAVDLEDSEGGLGRAILSDPGLLDACDLYVEHPNYTDGWLHCQTRPTKSGRRIFVP